jgi:hypothetical protein
MTTESDFDREMRETDARLDAIEEKIYRWAVELAVIKRESDSALEELRAFRVREHARLVERAARAPAND